MARSLGSTQYTHGSRVSIARSWPERLHSTYTPLTEAAFRQALRDEQPSEGVVNLLADMLAGWDLQEDDGSVVTIAPERLRSVGTPILGAIINAIMGDMNPDPQKDAS